MALQSSNLDQFVNDVAKQIIAHFRNNPFRLHFASWQLAAVPFAILMLPELSVVSVVAYGISAFVFCTILCVVTYPLSGHYSFTIVGALFGAAMLPLGELLGVFSPINSQVMQTSLLTGAILGSTSVIWRIPLQILDEVRKI